MEDKFNSIRENLTFLEEEHKLYRKRIAKLESTLSEMIRITEKLNDPKSKDGALKLLEEGLPQFKRAMKDSEHNINMALLGTGYKGTLFDK